MFAPRIYSAEQATKSDGKENIFAWPSDDVPESVVKNAPRWNPETGEIPLSPRNAYVKALEAFSKLGLGEGRCSNLALSVNPDRPTAYAITFDSGLDLNRKSTFVVGIFVYLDGTVVAPKLIAK
jgi:hypothetical protein